MTLLQLRGDHEFSNSYPYSRLLLNTRRITIVFAACFTVVSCASTMAVNTKQTAKVSENESVAGLPFFLRTRQTKQVTAYEQAWADVSLTISWKARTVSVPPAPTPLTTVFSKRILMSAGNNAATIQELRTALGEPDLKTDSAMKGHSRILTHLFSQLTDMTVDDRFAPTSDTAIPRIIANTVYDTVVVDYSRQYYINSRMPWFGSNTITAELAADGTLSKNTAETESTAGTAVKDLLATVMAPLPLAELFTARWGLGDKPDSAVAKPQDVKWNRPVPQPTSTIELVASLELTPGRTVWEFYQTLPTSESIIGGIPYNLKIGQFSRREERLGTTGRQPAIKADSDGTGGAITFEGAVKLPKAPEKAKPPAFK